jgi:hypothetical protein
MFASKCHLGYWICVDMPANQKTSIALRALLKHAPDLHKEMAMGVVAGMLEHAAEIALAYTAALILAWLSIIGEVRQRPSNEEAASV